MAIRYIDSEGMMMTCDVCDAIIPRLTQAEYAKQLETGGWKALTKGGKVDYCICPQCLRQHFTARSTGLYEGNAGRSSQSAICCHTNCGQIISHMDTAVFRKLLQDGGWLCYDARLSSEALGKFCLCGKCSTELLKRPKPA